MLAHVFLDLPGAFERGGFEGASPLRRANHRFAQFAKGRRGQTGSAGRFGIEQDGFEYRCQVATHTLAVVVENGGGGVRAVGRDGADEGAGGTGVGSGFVPRKVNANGSAATVNVGVVRPALKAMAWASTVSVNTTRVPVVTALLNVVVLLLTTSKVLSAALPPTTPCAVMLPKLPASSVKLRVLAVSPLTVCMNFKSPPVCTATSVKTFTMSLNTALWVT